MEPTLANEFRGQLSERRERLSTILSAAPEATDVLRLLQEVDSALERIEQRSFGTCEICQLEVDEPDLRARPTLPWCLCNLSPEQQAAFEQDMGLASRVQWSLLPEPELRVGGWETAFRYEPAGALSGDYLDLLGGGAGEPLLALVGDVSGKGVSASLLMARLSALLRTLAPAGLPLPELLERASRLFAEAKLASQYATLVAARAHPDGRIELGNAGHCWPLVVRDGAVREVAGSGLPVGLVGGRGYRSEEVKLAPEDSLLLYTDGLTEAFDGQDRMYGKERLMAALEVAAKLPPRRLLAALVADQRAFLGGRSRGDDLALLLLRRRDR